MEISVERILDLLPSDAQILCRRPTAKIIGPSRPRGISCSARNRRCRRIRWRRRGT